MIWFFNLLARLPLSALHRLGTLFGWITYFYSGRYAARLRENLQNGLKYLHGNESVSEAHFRRILHANVSEVGKSVMELPWIWKRPLEEVIASVKVCHGWENIETAQALGKGVIMMTPHCSAVFN